MEATPAGRGMNCSVCGQPKPEEEMIPLEGRWVCAACKPTLIQQLKEGCPAWFENFVPERFDERVIDIWPLVTLSGRLWLRDWKAITGMTLLVSIPINLSLKVVRTEEGASWTDFGRLFSSLLFLATVVAVLATLGIAKVVSERMAGRSLGLGGALMHAVRHWWPAVKTGLMASLIVGALLLLFIVPGLIWVGYYTFSTIAVSLQDRAGSRALAASKSLVEGRWWTVVGRSLVLTGITMAAIVPIQIGMEFVPHRETLFLCVSVLMDVCSSFITVGTTVLFLNLEAMRQPDPKSDSLVWRQ